MNILKTGGFILLHIQIIVDFTINGLTITVLPLICTIFHILSRDRFHLKKAAKLGAVSKLFNANKPYTPRS